MAPAGHADGTAAFGRPYQRVAELAEIPRRVSFGPTGEFVEEAPAALAAASPRAASFGPPCWADDVLPRTEGELEPPFEAIRTIAIAAATTKSAASMTK
jgi:hypothetical protein